MLPYFRNMEAFFDLSLPKSWADLSDPQLLFFFRQLATDKPMAEIQTLCLCQWANVLVRCRLYGSVYLVQHGKQQATLTLHQFVCAITALDFLKSFSPYPNKNKDNRQSTTHGSRLPRRAVHRLHLTPPTSSPHGIPSPTPTVTVASISTSLPSSSPSSASGISDTKHHRHSEQHTFSQGQRVR